MEATNYTTNSDMLTLLALRVKMCIRDRYWTSTEVEGQQTVKAWLYSTASGAMQETPKTQAHKEMCIRDRYKGNK